MRFAGDSASSSRLLGYYYDMVYCILSADPPTHNSYLRASVCFAHVSKSMTSGNTRFVCATLSVANPCAGAHRQRLYRRGQGASLTVSRNHFIIFPSSGITHSLKMYAVKPGSSAELAPLCAL
jgi:hypothetical protein